MNTPKIVQCQSCNKQLMYTGSKQIITCPSCGALVPVPVLTLYHEEPIQAPPIAPPVSANPIELPLAPPPKQQTKKTPIKPLPMHIAAISCIWAFWALMVIWSGYYALTRFYPASEGMIRTEFGWKTSSEFLFIRFVGIAITALFYAVLAAIPTFLIWNHHNLKDKKSSNST